MKEFVKEHSLLIWLYSLIVINLLLLWGSIIF